MTIEYQFSKIEAKIQANWNSTNALAVSGDSRISKSYNESKFQYPSGK